MTDRARTEREREIIARLREITTLHRMNPRTPGTTPVPFRGCAKQAMNYAETGLGRDVTPSSVAPRVVYLLPMLNDAFRDPEARTPAMKDVAEALVGTADWSMTRILEANRAIGLACATEWVVDALDRYLKENPEAQSARAVRGELPSAGDTAKAARAKLETAAKTAWDLQAEAGVRHLVNHAFQAARHILVASTASIHWAARVAREGGVILESRNEFLAKVCADVARAFNEAAPGGAA